jgi:hypothetical protein
MTTAALTLDTIFRSERIIIDGKFVGTISLSFPNKTDCFIIGFNGVDINPIRYRRRLFDLVRKTGRKNILYTCYKGEKEIKRVIKL